MSAAHAAIRQGGPMDYAHDRRTYPRLRYGWQMYYERPEQGRCDVGRMVDLSEVAARFRVSPTDWFQPGSTLTVRFSHPHVSDEYGFEVRTVSREVEVLRSGPTSSHANEVVVRLTQPLHYSIDEQCVPG